MKLSCPDWSIFAVWNDIENVTSGLRANFHSGKRCDEDIIKHIASDIRDQHRLRTERKLELSKLKDTFDRLNTKVSY